MPLYRRARRERSGGYMEPATATIIPLLRNRAGFYTLSPAAGATSSIAGPSLRIGRVTTTMRRDALVFDCSINSVFRETGISICVGRLRSVTPSRRAPMNP
jgi:hypothetical protein